MLSDEIYPLELCALLDDWFKVLHRFSATVLPGQYSYLRSFLKMEVTSEKSSPVVNPADNGHPHGKGDLELSMTSGQGAVEYVIDPAEGRAVLRKIDWIVMSSMTFVYFFQCKPIVLILSCHPCPRPCLTLSRIRSRSRQADDQLRLRLRA